MNMVVNTENGGGSNMLLTPRSDIEAHKYTDCGKLGFKEKNKGSFAVFGGKIIKKVLCWSKGAE